MLVEAASGVGWWEVVGRTGGLVTVVVGGGIGGCWGGLPCCVGCPADNVVVA